MSKRAFDVIAAFCALILLGPLLLVIAAWVKLDSRGPVLFRQERVGRLGCRFRIHKFRTMVVDAAARGPAVTAGNDSRAEHVEEIRGDAAVEAHIEST